MSSNEILRKDLMYVHGAQTEVGQQALDALRAIAPLGVEVDGSTYDEVIDQTFRMPKSPRGEFLDLRGVIRRPDMDVYPEEIEIVA